jgi:NAD(P)-dependent dehydrogenase (short-subunit alcohol dehydrogenase family)
MGSEMFSVKGKSAIVTGAGRGIGKAIALTLAAGGAKVVAAARTAEQVQATVDEIKKNGGEAIAVIGDVRVKEKVDNIIAEAVNAYGRIDVMVNNAGGYFPVSAMEMSEKQWDVVITENLKSVFLCSQTAGKVMMGQKSGSIINISSTAGVVAYQTNAAYAAAKAGIISFTKTLAVDLAPFNIRVNAIAPGAIVTPGSEKFYEGAVNPFGEVPLSRGGKPEEVAAGVVFLASDASSYMTGATILMDGGATVKSPLSK